jgi:hypothetical protein
MMKENRVILSQLSAIGKVKSNTLDSAAYLKETITENKTKGVLEDLYVTRKFASNSKVAQTRITSLVNAFPHYPRKLKSQRLDIIRRQ